MRRLIPAAAAVCFLTPQFCHALMFCVSGNEPQSAANYTDWPGLVDAVNDPSRVQLCWCNGDETLWYQGDTQALNRMLVEFSEAELTEHNVVLLPGDGPLNKTEGGVSYDWMLHIVAGLARSRIERFQLENVQDVHPTLTVYVTDRIDLAVLHVPESVTLLQSGDLRTRCENALQNGTEQEQKYAQQFLDRLDSQSGATEGETQTYLTQIRAIQEFVKLHTEE